MLGIDKITLFDLFLSIYNVNAFRQAIPNLVEVALSSARYLLTTEGMDGNLMAAVCREQNIIHIRSAVNKSYLEDATSGTGVDISLKWTNITQVADKTAASVIAAGISTFPRYFISPLVT